MVIALEQSLIARQLVPLTVTCALLHMAIISSYYSMYYTIWTGSLLISGNTFFAITWAHHTQPHLHAHRSPLHHRHSPRAHKHILLA